jgi:hypothetical protein
MSLTNTWKHFGVMLLLGIAAWLFAYIGEAQGLGWFPNIAALMVTIWVVYRQWSRSGKPVLTLARERGLDSLVDILAGGGGGRTGTGGANGGSGVVIVRYSTTAQ